MESKRGGYSAASYIQLLDKMILIVWDPDLTFMQDNALIHTAKKVKEWFKNNSISLLEWPPYSPDLNPIENLWAKLKELVYKVDPGLEYAKGGKEAVQEAIERALIKAWRLIPQEYFDACWKSMPRRVAAVKEANGWHTKY